MTRRPVRILCVDDHAILAEGLKTRLGLEPDMEVVGWLESADRLAAEAQRVSADVVLLDLDMPGPDPFEMLRDVHRRRPGTRVIILSAHVRDHYIDTAVKAGAWGYLSKSDAPDDVVQAIRKVSADEFAFGPSVLKRRVEPERRSGEATSKLDQLTNRELQILRMIGRGMSRTEIAREIHRSPKTVDNHRASIMRKLEIHDRVELARYALREGLSEAG